MMFLLSAALLARADGPAVRINPLPDGWKPGIADSDFIQTGSSSALAAHFEMHLTPKPGDKLDLAQWAAIEKKLDAKDSIITDRKETALKPATIGDRKVIEYEITGALFGLQLHYRIFYFEVGKTLCNLKCWTTPAHWDAANPQFETLVKNVK